MKNTLILGLMILFLFSCGGNKKIKKSVEVDDKYKITYIEGEYEITKIDSTRNLYIFYAKRNDSIFKLISEKIEPNKSDSFIEQGKSYFLRIHSIFSPNFYQKLEISEFEFDGSVVKLGTNGSVWDLFKSKNIKGRCYLGKNLEGREDIPN